VRALVIYRDRVTYAQRCVASLTAAGLDVCLVDCGSTWLPAVHWLAEMEAAGTLVLYRGSGHHPQSLWRWEPFRTACGSGRYIVTDPDVVPSEDCPGDWVDHLNWLLDQYPHEKAGLGLRLDRIPEIYQRRDHVLAWERQFWEHPLADGVYEAAVDTTLAMYRPLSEVPEFPLEWALRTGPPYVADHLAWYEDLYSLTTELRYYHEHADSGITYWTIEGRSAWGD
jgi:hypothetical protein